MVFDFSPLQLRPHRGPGLRGRHGRERGDGEAGRGVGVPAVPERSIVAGPRTAGQGRPAGPVGTTGNRTLPALGLAARDLRGPGDPCAGVSDRRPILSRQQQRFHLRRQATLRGDDQLRGGEVLPDRVRGPLPGWGQGRRTV